jgi:hypothetical protein
MKTYTGDMYAHTGVTVNQTVKWQHVIGNWNDNTVQPKFTNLGGGKYQLIISPSAKIYYSVLPTEEVTQLCFVFRNSDGSLKASDTDIFLPIAPSSLNIHVQQPAQNPFLVDANTSFTVAATGFQAEKIKLAVDDQTVTEISGDTFSYSLTSSSVAGSHKMTLTSQKGSQTVSTDVYYFVPPTIPVLALDPNLKAGINYIDDKTVTLVLFAPKKKFILAIGDFND